MLLSKKRATVNTIFIHELKQCIEIIHKLYQERDVLQEMCIDDYNTGGDVLNGLANMCLVKVNKVIF